MPPSLSRLLDTADDALPLFRERTRGITRETKGIRPSEMFFLFATLVGERPRRIVESGRARGQSTLVLARCFPDTLIISIESDPHSPDVAVAKERLADCQNVDCRFGDARVLLPQIVEPSDAILIDGPKDFRAAKLALRLLGTGRPSAVFVHDLPVGVPVRRFFDAHVPSAFFSDEPELVRRFSFLDHGTEPPPPLPGFTAELPRREYGATLGCIPGGLGGSGGLMVPLTLAQWRDRLRDTGRKLLGRHHD